MKVEQQKEAAEILGVTATALRKWMKIPGFPDCSAGFDIPKIRKWQQDTAKKGSQLGTDLQKLKVAREAARLRKERVDADRAERLEEVARGNILPRDELTLSVAEIIQLATIRLMTIPKTLCRHLPKKYHRVLQREGERDVRKILEEMGRSLRQVEREAASA